MPEALKRWLFPVAALFAYVLFSMDVSAAAPEFEVTGVIVNEIVDGAAPFDGDNNPGNDANNNNRVVRTFDNVRYTMEVAMNMKKGASVRSLSSAVLGVELSIPCNEGEFGFATGDMGWLSPGYTVTYEDGRAVLRGQTSLKQVEGADPVPGTAAFTVSINARAARNGQMLEPTFKVWADGEEGNAKSFVCDRNHRTADGQLCAVRVSCTSKGLDVQVSPSTICYGYLNPSTGAMDVEPVEGGKLAAMQALMMGICFHSDSAEKGVKGMECPNGAISFDLQVTENRSRGNKEGVSIWDMSSLKMNYFQSYRGDLNGRQMNWFTSCTGGGLPGCAGNGGGNQCSDGGDWSIQDLGNGKYRLTVQGYTVTDYFPRQHLCTAGGTIADPRNWNIGTDRNFFTTVMLNVYTTVSDGVESGTYGFGYEAGSLSAKSVSGASMRDMYPGNDKSSGSVSMRPAGTRMVRHSYNYGSGGDSTNYVGAGRSAGYSINAAVRERGDTFSVGQYLDPTNDGAMKGYTWASEYLFKFDDQVYAPVEDLAVRGGYNIWAGLDNSWYGSQDTSKFQQKKLYAALKSGKGFGGDEALMRSTEIKDCVFYDTLDALEADGKTCIGYLFEARNMQVPARHYWSHYMCTSHITVREDAPIDSVGYVFGGLEAWTGDSSAGKGLTLEDSHGPGGKALPEPDSKYYDNGYKGATWSSAEEGREWLTTGGPYGLNGSSSLVIGEIAKAGIALENGQSVYNLNYGERTADLVLSPALESKTGSCGKSTMHVQVTLPKHLYYQKGSAVAGGEYVPATGGVGSVVLDGEPFEPTVAAGEDGCTLLTWEYRDVLPEGAFPRIHFKVDIGTLADPVADVLETDNPLTAKVRTWSTYGAAYGERAVTIRVVKALATSLYFKSIDGSIEKNGDARWRMVMSNYSAIDSKPWTMYVATPYSGDERDSGVSGKLPLKSITLDASRCSRSLAGGFHVYVTTDPGVRKYSGDRFDASQMDAITSGWTEVQPTKSGNSWTYAIGKDVTCIKFAGGLIGAREAFTFILNYDPESCVGGDAFVNSVSVFSERFPSTIFSAPSDVNVVNRILSGYAYNDRNKNAYKDLDAKKGDVAMAGVTLRLLKADGSRMTDINGKEIADVVTGKDGSWRFEDFGPGAVKVAVVKGKLDSKYELAPYMKYDGDDGSKKGYLSLDNDFSGAAMECGSVRVFGEDGYSMRELSFRPAAEMNPPVQEIGDIGLGLAVYWSDLTAEKVVDASHYVPAFGSHTYWFKADGTAWDGSHKVYYIPVSIGETTGGVMPHLDAFPVEDAEGEAVTDIPAYASTKQGKTTVRVPSGNYRVTELSTDGWEFLDFLAVNGIVDGDHADMDLLINETGLANARDYRVGFGRFRDADVSGNKLKQ